jgi:hypothetical protein
MGHSRSLTVIAAVATLAVAAWGCGGSSGNSSTQAPAITGNTSPSGPAPSLSGGSHADQQAVLATVSGYYAALQAHQGPQACSYLTQPAQRHIVAQISAHTTTFGHTCTQVLGGVGLLLSGQVHVVSGSVHATSAGLVIQGKTRGNLALTKTSGRWLISGTS